MNDPNSVSEDFLFSLDQAKITRKKLRREVEELSDRIAELGKKSAIANGRMDVIDAIIANLSQDPKEIKILGKALIRVAEILPRLNESKKMLTVAEVSCDNSLAIASMFGNFDLEIDKLEKLSNTGFPILPKE